MELFVDCNWWRLALILGVSMCCYAVGVANGRILGFQRGYDIGFYDALRSFERMYDPTTKTKDESQGLK